MSANINSPRSILVNISSLSMKLKFLEPILSSKLLPTIKLFFVTSNGSYLKQKEENIVPISASQVAFLCELFKSVFCFWSLYRYEMEPRIESPACDVLGHGSAEPCENCVDTRFNYSENVENK